MPVSLPSPCEKSPPLSSAALAESARTADDATAFVLHLAAAFGADMDLARRDGRLLRLQRHKRGVAVLRRWRRFGNLGLCLRIRRGIVRAVVDIFADLEQHARNRVRTGGAAHVLLAYCRGAADSLELVVDLAHGDAAAQRDGGEPRRSLALARAAARFAGACEHLANTVFIIVDGDIQRAAADVHLLRKPARDERARAGFDPTIIFRQGGVQRRLTAFRFAFVDAANIEHLAGPASVAIDRYAL
ncbi:hypothetical protein SDC9_119086 [bioreactor metagenome]|uniref:Uncharacterized protein n=1 Tax=bioreactor metagenome TaxID=1076179 RepID=A0A645C8H7_9ZZZZ